MLCKLSQVFVSFFGSCFTSLRVEEPFIQACLQSYLIAFLNVFCDLVAAPLATCGRANIRESDVYALVFKDNYYKLDLRYHTNCRRLSLLMKGANICFMREVLKLCFPKSNFSRRVP